MCIEVLFVDKDMESQVNLKTTFFRHLDAHARFFRDKMFKSVKFEDNTRVNPVSTPSS